MASIEPPLLTLDEIVIVAKHGKESERLVLTGADLGHVLSLCDAHGGPYGLADSGDVNIRLRGLAQLVMGQEGEGQDFNGDAAYFITNTLRDLAAKLEASRRAEDFNVFLRKKGADGKTVA